MTDTIATYVSAATGNKLERVPDKFYLRGRWFHGLVDVQANTLYDDPSDSFAEHTGISSSLEQGLIALLEQK